jgi:hypothetical protein
LIETREGTREEDDKVTATEEDKDVAKIVEDEREALAVSDCGADA